MAENGTPPEGWTATTLGTVLTDLQPGFAAGKHSSDGQGLAHLRPMNVSRDGRIDLSDLRSIDPSLANKPARRLRRGDVLFNNTNSLELVGKTALFDGDDEPAFSNHMTRLRVDPTQAAPAFVAALLHERWRTGEFRQLANNHVSQASVGRAVLASLPVALPPIPSQNSIAELVAEINARRVSIKDRLAAARAIVDRLRAAVLAAACSGRLTVDWRDAEPAEALQAAPEGSGRVIEFALPDLPSTYKVTTVGAVSVRIEYGTSKKADAEGEVPVLRMGNIQDGRLDTNDLKYLPRDAEVERLLLDEGDLLFNRTNSPDLVGKTAVFHDSEPATFASYLIRVRFRRELIDPDFVGMWLNSAWGRAWARQVKTDGVSQSNINGKKLASMALPLPPIDEQREIVARASAALATADRVTAGIRAADVALAGATRGALAQAFSGQLPHT